MARSVIRPMPTEWWLRPVRRHARVGEHNAVVWKFVNVSPPAASRSIVGVCDVGAVGAGLGEADVVEQHHDDVGRAVVGANRFRPPRFGVGIPAAETAFELSGFHLRTLVRHGVGVQAPNSVMASPIAPAR